MTAHTPGPWEWEKSHGRFGHYYLSLLGDGGTPVILYEDFAGMSLDGSDAVRDANARLIAAAPELLDLAYEMMDFAEAAMDDADLEGDLMTAETWHVRFDRARAAIAKATGEKSDD